MALIFCKECGKEISDQAESCPNCGCPVKEPKNKKFCIHCGESIDKECVVCPKCGKQVENLQNNNDKNIVINNNAVANTSTPAFVFGGKPKNKWISFLLCLFLGYLGAHKFYEGKILLGILYLITFGLFGIGIIIDLILLLFKPNPYYV